MRGLREVESQRVADLIGDSAVYTGNHGQRTGLPVSVNLQISDITRTSAEAANLEISLAP